MLPRQQHVLDALTACAEACEQSVSLILAQPKFHLASPCINVARDCADLCRLVATFVARQSSYLVHLLRECAELCRACADEHACLRDSGEFFSRHEALCRRAEDACRTAFI